MKKIKALKPSNEKRPTVQTAIFEVWKTTRNSGKRRQMTRELFAAIAEVTKARQAGLKAYRGMNKGAVSSLHIKPERRWRYNGLKDYLAGAQILLSLGTIPTTPEAMRRALRLGYQERNITDGGQ